jgi:N-dimethylarginine dimethylaminohydrolase
MVQKTVKPDLKEAATKEMEVLVEQHNELVKILQESQGRLTEVKNAIIEKQGYMQGLEACEKNCEGDN